MVVEPPVLILCAAVLVLDGLALTDRAIRRRLAGRGRCLWRHQWRYKTTLWHLDRPLAEHRDVCECCTATRVREEILPEDDR